ncbi:MAG: DUF3604 domain-containing protein [Chlamydiota bacterium]|nr:DUF3604 domain-containing protein [Chlamydiota bacterium]
MRRSICYCEPNYALAGEINTWKFIYTTATTLPKGTLLKFDPQSDGRSIDWEIPNANVKCAGNIIYAMTDNGKILSATEVESKDRFTPQYEFTLPQDLEVGENFTVVLGAPKDKETNEKTGNMAQSLTQRRKNFYLYIDTAGKGQYQDPEVFSLDIRGNVLSNIRILVPSFVTKNKRFDVVARFEDEFGNLTNNAEPETLIELSYENIRENLNWKLFVPETGFITLPNLYFNEPGIYTIQFKNLTTGDVYKGPPISCFSDSKNLLFWGTLHGESEKVDSTENLENCIRHFRDEKAYNFYSTSPFESQEETSAEQWKLCIQNIAEFDEPERFTTILGFQWSGTPHTEGVRQIVFAKDNKPLIRKKDPKGATLKKLYKNFAPKEIISIPCFTMAEGNDYDFDNFDPEFERVVEIYNAWGSSECTKKEGNTRPIHCPGNSGVKEKAEGAISKALLRNCRFGFVAGGLDDRGIYGQFFDSDQVQYSPGLTAIMAPEYSRSSIIEALYQRSCYATTGERMIIGYEIAGVPMGGEVSTADKPGLTVNRHIDGFAAGTKPITKIEIIRNGKVLETIEPEGEKYHYNFTYDDMISIDKVMLDNKDKKPPFVFYYIRVTQQDGHIAWGSPIWIDYVLLTLAERKAKRPAKPVKQISAIDSFNNDLDFQLDVEEEDNDNTDYDDDDNYDDDTELED